MARLYVDPEYTELLAVRGLSRPAEFVSLPGVVVSGHPDRHVRRVDLPGSGDAYLKLQHRVTWRERLGNFLAGFGLVSRSTREAVVLRALRQAGISAPPVVADGEGDGKAFVLLQALPGRTDLRHVLEDAAMSSEKRRRLARKLGEAIARLHFAGFDQPDLYAKHVLLDPSRTEMILIDWQRTRIGPVSFRRRVRDLAAFNASVPDGLVTDRERLVFFRAYHRAAGLGKAVAHWLSLIRKETVRLIRQPRYREMRQPSPAAINQQVIWLDGEAVCVTPEFHRRLTATVAGDPSPLSPRPASSCLAGRGTAGGEGSLVDAVSRLGGYGETRTVISLPEGQRGVLVQRQTFHPLGWLRSKLRGKRFTTPELAKAGTLFRLQRYGVEAPALFAFGQRLGRFGRTNSFLLTEDRPAGVPWIEGLSHCASAPKDRRRLIRQAGKFLRDIHRAGFSLARPVRESVPVLFKIEPAPAGQSRVVVGAVESLRAEKRIRGGPYFRDLAALHYALPAGRTDRLRFLLAYLGVRHLPLSLKPIIRKEFAWKSRCATKA